MRSVRFDSGVEAEFVLFEPNLWNTVLLSVRRAQTDLPAFLCDSSQALLPSNRKPGGSHHSEMLIFAQLTRLKCFN